MLGIERLAGSLLFYALAAVVAAMGLRALGVAESFAVAGMAMVFAVLASARGYRTAQKSNGLSFSGLSFVAQALGGVCPGRLERLSADGEHR